MATVPEPLRVSETLRGQQERSWIPTLDGWRAVAILLVIGAHSQSLLYDNGSWLAMTAWKVFGHTGFGVDIFFALSGYLISTRLLQERELYGTISLPRFYVRRAFRILPPLLFYLVVIALMSSSGLLPHISRMELSSSVFFFRNYMEGTRYTGHYWSLSVEEHFYLVVPLLLLLFDRIKAIRICLLLILLCIVVRAVELANGAEGGIGLRTENRYDCLLWGTVMALFLRDSAAKAWLRSYLRPRNAFLLLTASIVLLTLWNSPAGRRTTVAFVMPLFVLSTVLYSDSPAARFLDTRVMRWIGRISYSLYLWQMLFLPGFERPLGVVQSFPLALIGPFFCAAFSYYLVEKPMIRIGHRLTPLPTPPE